MWWIYSHLTGSWNEQCLWFLSILTFCSRFLMPSLTCYSLTQEIKAYCYLLKRTISTCLPWVPPFTNVFAWIWAGAASHTIKHWLLLVNLQLLPLHFKASSSTSAVLTITTPLPLCLRVRLISHIPSAGHWQSRIPSQPHLTSYSCVLPRVSGCWFLPWVLAMGFSRPVREGWGWATLLTTPLQA